MFGYKMSCAVNSCVFLSDVLCVGGCHDGSIGVMDLRKTSNLVCTIHRSKSPILSMKAKDQNNFMAATADGCCFTSSVSSVGSELGVVEWDDMTGADCDPIYGMAMSGKTLYTCCRDSVIRKYSLT